MRLTEGSVAVHVGDGTVKPHVFTPAESPGYASDDVLVALHTDEGPGSPLGAIFFQGHPDALVKFAVMLNQALAKFRTDTGR